MLCVHNHPLRARVVSFLMCFRCVQNRQMSLNLLESLGMDVEIPEVSEDCLYLNVYTPARSAEDAKLPVSSTIK